MSKITIIHTHRHEWWVPGKILDIRRRLDGIWRAPGVSRDVLLLDIALDNYFRSGEAVRF